MPSARDTSPSVDPTMIRLLTCIGVELELVHLPHFLRHYLDLGILPGNIHILLNTTDAASPRLATAKEILATFGVSDVREWIGDYTSDVMWQQRRSLQLDVVRPGDWVLNADVDEHHHYPAPLTEICSYCQRKDFNSVQGVLVDRLAENGELIEVDSRPELSQQFPVEAEVQLALIGCGKHHGVDSTTKLMLHSYNVLPGRGGHNPWRDGEAGRFLVGARLATFPQTSSPAFRFSYPFRVDHYKWTSTRKATYERRMATPGVSPAGLEEGGKLTRYLDTHGRIRPEDVAVRSKAFGFRANWRTLSLLLRLQARLRYFLARKQRLNFLQRRI
ncbi:hypothetical protein [Allohahella sp. A8]|uniref:hypothetical protein n=1 Tax=Allohahella sp. A8 TaxID=3141461 RepID=UPI003A8085FD